jgi:hypothetical protein
MIYLVLNYIDMMYFDFTANLGGQGADLSLLKDSYDLDVADFKVFIEGSPALSFRENSIFEYCYFFGGITLYS